MAEKGIRTVWIDSDSVGVLGTKVYRDDILIATVPIGTQIYNDPTAIVGVEYKYEVQAYTSSSESTDETLGVNMDYYEIVEPVVNLMPIMTNFRVDDAVKNRILFDTPLGAVTGLSEVGFVVTGKGVQSVDDELNFITVDSDFNYWDNNSIKLSGGNGIVYDFTKEPITNNIVITEAATSTFFVDGSVGSSGDGLTEGTAFKTLLEGFNAMPASNIGGGKLWVKAFDYGNQRIDMQTTYKNGTATNPNVIEGYKTTPGDIDSMYYTYNINSTLDALDPNEMPLFDGGSRSSTQNFISFWDSSYWIVRNVQFTNYLKGMWAQTLTSIEVENCLGLGFGEITSNNGIGLAFNPNENDSHKVRIKDTIIINATLDSYIISGDNFLVDNCKAYCNEAASVNDNNATTDYYYQFNGNNGLVLNSLCYKDTPNGDGHAGHGFSFKSDGGAFTVENNLVKGCEAVNIRGSYQARHISCRYNDFKDSIARANVPNRKSHADYCYSAAIELFSGGSYNTFENITAYDLDAGVIFLSNAESDSTVNIQNNALIKNCTFDKMKWFIYGENATTGTSAPYDNVIDHCTINDADYFSWITSRGGFAFGNNYMRSNIFNDVPLKDREVSSDGWDYNFCLYWDSWTIGTRANAINVDPDLIVVDYTSDDYMTPQATFASIDVPRKDGIYYDKNGNERQDPTTVGGVMSPSEVAVEPPIEEYDFYVSATGTGDGLTSDTPMSFLESQTTINSMTAGQSIAYKGDDEFYGSLSISGVNGSDGNPITITSYGTGQASIKGSEAVTGFADEGGNIWSVTTGAVYQVHQNGVRLINARNMVADSDLLPVTSVTNDQNQFIVEGLIGSPDIVGATVHVRTQPWRFSQGTISSFNSTTGEIILSPDINAYDISVGEDMFVCNHLNLLTTEGEWYYGGGKLYIYSTSAPTNIEATRVQTNLITVSGSSYLEFDNLEVKNTDDKGFALGTSSNIVIKNSTISDCYNQGVHFSTDVSDFSALNNTITGCMIDGIYTRSLNFTATGNTFDNIGRIDGLKNKIFYNGIAIEHNSDSGSGDNAYIANNIVTNNGYNGFVANGVNTIVEKNYLQDVCLSTNDGSAIYTIGIGSSGTTIQDNIIITNSNPDNIIQYALGIYLDDNSTNVLVRRNTIKNSYHGVFLHNTVGCTIEYNDIYHTAAQSLFLKEDTTGSGEGTMVNNIIRYNNVFSTIAGAPPFALRQGLSGGTHWDFGTYSNNIYYNPYSNRKVTLLTSAVYADIGNWEPKPFSLSGWQAYSSQDVGSTSDTYDWFNFTIDSYDGANQITNPDFEIDLTGWSAALNGTITRVERDDIPGNYCVEVSNMDNGKLLPNKPTIDAGDYVVEFDAQADILTQIKFTSAEDGGDTYLEKYIYPDTEWRSYKIYFTSTKTQTINTGLWGYGLSNVWRVDNYTLRKVTVSEEETRHVMVYNETDTTSSEVLPTGTWNSIDGSIVGAIGSVNVSPYSSIILITEDVTPPIDPVEIIRNGDFLTDTEWIKGSGWTIGGEANYDGSGGTSSLKQDSLIFEAGKTYDISVDVISNEGTGTNVIELGYERVNNTHLSVGNHTWSYTMTGDATEFSIFGRSGENFVIDNVSVTTDQ